MKLWERWLAIVCTTIMCSVVVVSYLDDMIVNDVWKGLPPLTDGLVHAQLGMTTIPLSGLTEPGCTQLVAGSATKQTWIYGGQIVAAAQGTGQGITISLTTGNGSAGNWNGTTNGTCATTGGALPSPGSTPLMGKITLTTTGTFNLGTPGQTAIVVPASSGVVIQIDTNQALGGYITVDQH